MSCQFHGAPPPPPLLQTKKEPLGAIQQRKYGVRICLDMMGYVKISGSILTPSLKPEASQSLRYPGHRLQAEGCTV
jgi:hypothetical protein